MYRIFKYRKIVMDLRFNVEKEKLLRVLFWVVGGPSVPLKPRETDLCLFGNYEGVV